MTASGRNMQIFSHFYNQNIQFYLEIRHANIEKKRKEKKNTWI